MIQKHWHSLAPSLMGQAQQARARPRERGGGREREQEEGGGRGEREGVNKFIEQEQKYIAKSKKHKTVDLSLLHLPSIAVAAPPPHPDTHTHTHTHTHIHKCACAHDDRTNQLVIFLFNGVFISPLNRQRIWLMPRWGLKNNNSVLILYLRRTRSNFFLSLYIYITGLAQTTADILPCWEIWNMCKMLDVVCLEFIHSTEFECVQFSNTPNVSRFTSENFHL